MRLMLKYIFRNIAARPLRTAVIIFCFAAVSLTFSMSLTINISTKTLIENFLRDSLGNSDIDVYSLNHLDEEMELPDGVSALYTSMSGTIFQLHDIKTYKYVQERGSVILGTDAAAAYEFGLIPENIEISDNEVIITRLFAATFGYKEGDSIMLPCGDGSELEFTVKAVMPNKKHFSIMPNMIVTTQKSANALLCISENSWNHAYVDVADNLNITAVYKELSEKYPDLSIEQLMGSPELDEEISGLAEAFFVIFAVVFLMIIFIISAFSKNIAAERMSVIGTLRSVGSDKTRSALTLLLECAVYGLVGGIVGSVLFLVLKDVSMGTVMFVDEWAEYKIYVPLYVPLAGILLSAAVSCVCSLASVISAAKMPLRDIIFGTKDSSYRLSRAGVIAGGIMLAACPILYNAFLGFVPRLLALVFLITGICLVIPLILTGISKLAAKTDGGKIPVLRLALIQLGTKKSAVAGTVICTAVITLTSAIFILARSVDRLYSVPNYDCDVIVHSLSERSERYRNITASKSEFIYNFEETVDINGNEVSANVFGYDGFELFRGISGLPEKIADDEIVIDNAMMRRLGLKEGDTVEVTLKKNTLRPVTLSFKLAGGCDSVYYDMRCISLLISLENYKSVYHDYPSTLLLNTDDPDVTCRQVVDRMADTMTAEEWNIQQQIDAASILGVLGMLIALGVILAMISLAGNQTIGFDQRKRELAALRSYGMSLRQLSRMLLAETLFSALISAAVFAASGRAVVEILAGVLGTLELNIPIYYEAGTLPLFIAAVGAAIILTTRLPIRSLKKMKTAELLKQE